MITAPTHQAAAELLTSQGVREALAQACAAAGSQSAWASAHRIDKATVSRVVNAQRDPSPEILAALGLLEVRRYMPVRRAHGGSNAR